MYLTYYMHLVGIKRRERIQFDQDIVKRWAFVETFIKLLVPWQQNIWPAQWNTLRHISKHNVWRVLCQLLNRPTLVQPPSSNWPGYLTSNPTTTLQRGTAPCQTAWHTDHPSLPILPPHSFSQPSGNLGTRLHLTLEKATGKRVLLNSEPALWIC
jgi:hypothetical protein